MVIGISETLRTFGTLCAPDGVSNEQLVRMVVNEIASDPEDLHKYFIVPVAAALIATWPCGAK
jgi:Rap1a immunity proteins